jgi:serine/threonine protein kinase
MYDFSVDAPRPYLVMEYVAGGSLADRLRETRAPDARAWDADVLARELLDALGYIHHAGIIHRKIKPANVLIGTDARARLTDFGIAKPSGATRLTKTGMVVGSGRYIAPEVMRGEPASERSDLYSLGVLIEQRLAPGAPPELSALVRHLTANQPERRPKSAQQALTALERDATETVPQINLYGRRTRPGARVSTVALVVLLALLAIALIGLAASGGGSRTSRSGPARPNPNAPLSSQLTQLDTAIDQSRR